MTMRSEKLKLYITVGVEPSTYGLYPATRSRHDRPFDPLPKHALPLALTSVLHLQSSAALLLCAGTPSPVAVHVCNQSDMETADDHSSHLVHG